MKYPRFERPGFGGQFASDVHISKDNIYFIHNYHKAYKNGNEIKYEGFENPETLQSISTSLSSIFESDGDLYILGTRSGYKSGGKNYPKTIVLWKNEKPQTIDNLDVDTFRSVFFYVHNSRGFDFPIIPPPSPEPATPTATTATTAVSLTTTAPNATPIAQPPASELLLKEGKRFLELKSYDRAITEFTKLIENEPNNKEAYSNRGWAYFYKDDFNRSITDYTKAIEIAPDEWWSYYRRGLAYKELANQKYDKSKHSFGINYKTDYLNAIADFEKALQKNPISLHLSSIYYHLKQIYSQLGDRKKNKKYDDLYRSALLN
jgi:tetratricopeptide (TPR) repeat protein